MSAVVFQAADGTDVDEHCTLQYNRYLCLFSTWNLASVNWDVLRKWKTHNKFWRLSKKKKYKIFHIYFYIGTWQIDFDKYVLTKYIKILSIWSVQTIIYFINVPTSKFKIL